MPKGDTLTHKQKNFVAEYLVDGHATNAAIRAGYSSRSAETQAVALMRNPKVKASLERAKKASLQRVEITADYVLDQYRQVWEASITDVLHETDRGIELKPINEWPVVWQRMTTPGELKRLKQRSKDGKDLSWDDVGSALKLSVFPKAEALAKIGQHVNVAAFPQAGINLQVNVDTDSLTARLRRGRERAAQRALEQRTLEVEATTVENEGPGVGGHADGE